jgi:membrane associated rhomboid family serine protease
MTQPPPPDEVVPTCYRHPDRETYVRCQRCNRPICPECQIPAAVGVQCPDDVRAGNRSVRQARTTLGGVARGAGTPVTIAILAITIVVSLADLYGSRRIGVELSMRPANVFDGEYYRLLTAALVHGNLFHLAVNMYSLWVLGSQLEPLLGRTRFLGLYVVGALGGGAASYALNYPIVDGQFLFSSVGASGAIFALLGAMLPVMRRLQLDLRPLFVLLAINAFIGFGFDGIDWKAHLGGLVVGVALGAGFAYAPKDRRNLVQSAAFAAVLIAILAVVVARTAQLT